MEHKRSPVVVLDTHIVVWLYDNLTEKLSPQAKTLIETGDLFISPIVLLEIKYLLEINRIKTDPDKIFHYLHTAIHLRTDTLDLLTIVKQAYQLTWTRDPFDRIITASAMEMKAHLITADTLVQKNYHLAVS